MAMSYSDTAIHRYRDNSNSSSVDQGSAAMMHTSIRLIASMFVDLDYFQQPPLSIILLPSNMSLFLKSKLASGKYVWEIRDIGKFRSISIHHGFLILYCIRSSIISIIMSHDCQVNETIWRIFCEFLIDFAQRVLTTCQQSVRPMFRCFIRDHFRSQSSPGITFSSRKITCTQSPRHIRFPSQGAVEGGNLQVRTSMHKHKARAVCLLQRRVRLSQQRLANARGSPMYFRREKIYTQQNKETWKGERTIFSEIEPVCFRLFLPEGNGDFQMKRTSSSSFGVDVFFFSKATWMVDWPMHGKLACLLGRLRRTIATVWATKRPTKTW